ncbi:DUF6667 domain-containing protein [Trueperella sp. LYQ141]|uniref:DUF6667 domain-containing protein n=1 Tax=Trueperella sp. LYQ141 TaxID=3391058 RepID=UPI003983A8BB
MGVDGAVLALGVLFLLAYVVPQITRKRSVMADAPIEERYSGNLRLLQERQLTQTGGEHGRIYLTERKMVQATTRTPEATKMRSVARDRSRARARIARRDAYQQRGLLGGIVCAVITLALWVVTSLTTMPVVLPILATVISGAYLFGFGCLVSTWTKLNDEDRTRIARANNLLGAAKPYRATLQNKIRSEADRGATDQRAEYAECADTEAAVAHAQAVANEANDEAQQPYERVVAAGTAQVSRDSQGVDGDQSALARRAVASHHAPADNLRHSAARMRQIRGAAAQANDGKASRSMESAGTSAFAQSSAVADMPSYTVKPEITKRAVKPYVAPEAPTADVPFRPTRLGQRLGDAQLDAPHAAPEATGAEEMRQDLLGGGSTLDALLDRRRA